MLGGALIALLPACTQMQWVSMSTGTSAGADAALAECRADARDEAWRDRWIAGWPPAFYEPDPDYPGWHHPFWAGRDLSGPLYLRLEQFCMRSKGFRQMPAEQP